MGNPATLLSDTASVATGGRTKAEREADRVRKKQEQEASRLESELKERERLEKKSKLQLIARKKQQSISKSNRGRRSTILNAEFDDRPVQRKSLLGQ